MKDQLFKDAITTHIDRQRLTYLSTVISKAGRSKKSNQGICCCFIFTLMLISLKNTIQVLAPPPLPRLVLPTQIGKFIVFGCKISPPMKISSKISQTLLGSLQLWHIKQYKFHIELHRKWLLFV